MSLDEKNKKMKDYFSIDPEIFSSINPKHVVIGFIVVVIIGIPMLIVVERYEAAIIAPYTDAKEHHKEKIEGIVKRKREYRAVVLIDFTDEHKFYFEKGENYEYNKYQLYRFINSGDSIVKPAFSDTLFIYRNNQEYFFVMGKRKRIGRRE